MKKESGFVQAKLILKGGSVFSHTPGTQASKNISVSIGLNTKVGKDSRTNIKGNTVLTYILGIFFSWKCPPKFEFHAMYRISFNVSATIF